LGRSIVITSGKGGTGKTTACAALSASLACMGERVLCIDMDVGLRNLDLALGLSDEAPPDLMDVIEGRVSLEDAVLRHPNVENLFFLAAPYSAPDGGVPPEGIDRLIADAGDCFDYCLIDAPAGMGTGFHLACRAADSAIIVVTTDASSYRDANRCAIELRRMGKTDCRLLVNRIRHMMLRRMNATVDDAVDTVGVRLIGIIPEDRAVMLAAARGVPLSLAGGSAAEAFERVSRRLRGENVPIKKIRNKF